MAWYNPFVKNSILIEQPKNPSFIRSWSIGVREAFKGEVNQNTQLWPTDVGEKHPFDSNLTEGVMKNYGLVAGIIDKYVDYIWGSGFCVHVTDKDGTALDDAEDFLEKFNRTNKMNVQGRALLKEALTKPGGYFNILSDGGKISGIQLLDGKYMYVKRDQYGTITGYNQYVGAFENARFDKTKIIPFTPDQIMALHYNVIGDSAYGLGLVYPNLNTINAMIGLDRDMSTLIHRKANAPLVIKLGNKEQQILPTPEDINAFRQDLQTLTPQTEWVVDANAEFEAIQFGDLGAKFTTPYDQGWKKLVAGFQIPEVLLGWGNIAEGLGGVQEEGWQRVIQTKREIADTQLENLYLKILVQNGYPVDSIVTIVWGAPTDKERTEKIAMILSMMPVVQPQFKFELEKQLAELIDVDDEVLATPEEQMQTENDQLAAQTAITTPTDSANRELRKGTKP